MKSIKSKIISIYIFLAFTIGIIGGTAAINFYNLGHSINGLMTDNYKSINAVNHMSHTLENQNMELLKFIYSGDQNTIQEYVSNESDFYKWYQIENNNLTEAGEDTLVKTLNNYYIVYQSLFSDISNIRQNNGSASAFKYYNNKIVKSVNLIRITLQKILSLNENAMFNGRANVDANAVDNMYIMLAISLAAAVICLVTSIFFTNKILKPLYLLKKNMELVSEGHLEQEVPILSNDEIGILSQEFNKMIKRLQKFEQSTKGNLINEKNRSLAIVKSISDPLVVIDTDYKVMVINKAYEMFFNVNETETYEKHFLEAIQNNDIFDHVKRLAASDETKHIPKIITIMIDTKQFYFDITVTKIRDEQNKIIGYVVLFQNVTKLKKLENTKSEFVSVISHELKTPLTSIMMGVSLLKTEGLGSINEKQADVIHAIEDDTERLTTLVNDVIRLSKIESDRELYNIQPRSIFGIAEKCTKTFTEISSAKDVQLISEITEDLPKVMADTEKICWVINNLISNAFKYTNAGDYITLKAYVKNKLMYISVSDTGIGIPEEYSNKIFDKFVKVTNYNNESGGTGLGLSIAKEIVERHKGTIWCESKLDEGSTFTFTLPIANKQ